MDVGIEGGTVAGTEHDAVLGIPADHAARVGADRVVRGMRTVRELDDDPGHARGKGRRRVHGDPDPDGALGVDRGRGGDGQARRGEWCGERRRPATIRWSARRPASNRRRHPCGWPAPCDGAGPLPRTRGRRSARRDECRPTRRAAAPATPTRGAMNPRASAASGIQRGRGHAQPTAAPASTAGRAVPNQPGEERGPRKRQARSRRGTR